ncbi:MAG: hypothetical protein OEY86_07265 [Nitrospira sp.]|nr:hypothetical protein [Nitrospira sp.]
MNCKPDPQKEVALPEGWEECFEKQPFSYAGITHSVFCLNNKSSNPPVLLLHELPGLSPETLAYAQELSKNFTVYVPLLFGKKGESSYWKGYWAYWGTSEWDTPLQGSAPIVNWLRGVVLTIEKQHPGQRIGIIGNCMTGPIPLALLDHPKVAAVVLAQPALPMRFWWHSDADKTSLGLSKDDWDKAKLSSAKIFGVRFKTDCIADPRQHEWLIQSFPNRFRNGEIQEDDYQENGEPTKVHSTLIGSWTAPGKLGDASHKTRKRVRDWLCQELGNSCPKR